MISTNRKESDMYDVSTYSDAELYELLDLSSPTDRELEAKIIFLYRKYKNMQNSSGDVLAKFFHDIHNHFFEHDSESDNESETIENEDEDDTIQEGMTTLLDAKKQQSANTDMANTANNKITIDISTDSRTFLTDVEMNLDDNGKRIKNSSAGEASSQKISLVSQQNYTTDTANPLLKETVTRVISIDSQYRADKNSLPTEFTFDLADPLKDVVSLSLYSVQIPYTWYTIAKSYGSNFFYIKGSSPGINNGNHDIQIAINPGNYDPTNLVAEINKSMLNTFTLYTDISFGKTNISYNPGNSKSYINIDITKQYSENDYNLNFPYYTTPNIYENVGDLDDITRARNSIPAFLGLNQQTYKLNTLNSGIFKSTDILNNNNMLYKIDPLSTTIKVIKYTSIINSSTSEASFYIPGVTPVDISFNITLSLLADGTTKHSRNEILADLSNQLFNSKYLSGESSISLIQVTDPNDIRYDSQYGSYYFQLELKPNRYTTNNITNSKLFIQFPDETNIASTNTRIWTGMNTNGLKSCFYFTDVSNELQLITAETPIVKQTNLYHILQGPYVSLKCVNASFISTANDISFALKLNQSTNTTTYTVSQMIDSINAGIIDQSFNAPFLDGLPNLSYTYSESSNRPPSTTLAYLDSNYNFSLAVDIVKTFGNNNYVIDFSGDSDNNEIFYKDFRLGVDPITGNPMTNSSLTGLISNRPVSFGSGFTIITGTLLFNIKPIQDMCGNELDNIGPIYYYDETYTFDNYYTYQGPNNLSTKMTTYLQNYQYQGKNLFTSDTTFTCIQDGQNITTFKVTLNLYINRQITSNDYSIQFIDNVNPLFETNSNLNFWYDPLNIDNNTFITQPFDLSNNSPYLIKYDNSSIITVKATKPIELVTINFASIPNTFKFEAYEDGVQTTLGTNDVVVTIPIYDENNSLIYYTRDMLLTTINKLLASNPLAYGTYLYLTKPDANHNYYLKIFNNINKIYHANDYKIVFYDAVSFVRCFTGAKGVQNTTWDSTLGWLLGFRNSTYYVLNNPTQTTSFNYYTSFLLSNSSGIYRADSNNAITIVGDTGVSTNLFNYFMVCLDDYNLNHLDDGMVTITGPDTSVPLPSYTDRSNFQCDPVTGQLTYNANTREYYSQLTQKQLYSLAQKSNAKNTTSSNILGGVSSSVYGKGPFTQDVFAVIPLKLNGLQNGQYFVEYGGTLQSNNRNYFGPVNIHRMSVKLISDKGNTVDLNGTNWSFSFLCQQLYKKKGK
jgi:hypothetical protein